MTDKRMQNLNRIQNEKKQQNSEERAKNLFRITKHLNIPRSITCGELEGKRELQQRHSNNNTHNESKQKQDASNPTQSHCSPSTLE